MNSYYTEPTPYTGLDERYYPQLEPSTYGYYPEQIQYPQQQMIPNEMAMYNYPSIPPMYTQPQPLSQIQNTPLETLPPVNITSLQPPGVEPNVPTNPNMNLLPPPSNQDFEQIQPEPKPQPKPEKKKYPERLDPRLYAQYDEIMKLPEDQQKSGLRSLMFANSLTNMANQLGLSKK